MPSIEDAVDYLNQQFLVKMWPMAQDLLSNQIISGAYWNIYDSEPFNLDVSDTSLDMSKLPLFLPPDTQEPQTLIIKVPGDGTYTLNANIDIIIGFTIQIEFSLVYYVTAQASKGGPVVYVHPTHPFVTKSKARRIQNRISAQLNKDRPTRFFESFRWDHASPIELTSANVEFVAGYQELDPRNAINVVIVADGYRPHELSNFDALVDEIAEKVRTEDLATRVSEPYASFASALRFWKVRDYTNDPNDPGQRVAVSYNDPVTGTQKCSLSNLHRLAQLGILAQQASPNVVIFLSKTLPGVLDSDARAITFGEVMLVPVRFPTTVATRVVHELGHALAQLADEYEEMDAAHQTRGYAGKEPYNPNVTLPPLPIPAWSDYDYSGPTYVPPPEKWQRWVNRVVTQGPRGGTPVPSVSPEGGYYFHSGIVRPTENCKMRHADEEVPFCPICREAITGGLRGILTGSSALIQYRYLAPPRGLPGHQSTDWYGPLSRFFVRSEDPNHVDSHDLVAFDSAPPVRVRLKLLASSLPEDWQFSWSYVAADGSRRVISQLEDAETGIEPGSRIELVIVSTCDYTPWTPFLPSEIFIHVGHSAVIPENPYLLAQLDPDDVAVPIGGSVALAYDPNTGLAITPQVALLARAGAIRNWTFIPTNLEFRISGPSIKSRRFLNCSVGSRVTYLPGVLPPGEYRWDVVAFAEGQSTPPSSLALNGSQYHFRVDRQLACEEMAPHDPVSLFVNPPMLLHGRHLGNIIELGATSFDLNGDSLKLEFEVKPLNQAFDEQNLESTPFLNPTFESLRVTGSIGLRPSVNVNDFRHWRVRAIDTKDLKSNWVEGDHFSTYQLPIDLIPPFLDPRFEDAARRLRDGFIGDFASTAVFAGAVIEAALRYQLLRYRDLPGDVSKWDLSRLIKTSIDLGIVSDRLAALPQAVRQYRARANRTGTHDSDLKFGVEELRATLEVLELLTGRPSR